MFQYEHEQDCIKELGAPFSEVHSFLDQFAQKYSLGVVHRMVLHHGLGIALVGLLMGDKARIAARLHVLADVRHISAGPEWFLTLPAYLPTSGQEDALESDMRALLGYAPDFYAAWATISPGLKCECGYPGPMQTLLEAGSGQNWRCPWCAAEKTERFETLRKMLKR